METEKVQLLTCPDCRSFGEGTVVLIEFDLSLKTVMYVCFWCGRQFGMIKGRTKEEAMTTLKELQLVQLLKPTKWEMT